jgi:5-methylcytosine-specific restriction endonuclease McrA
MESDTTLLLNASYEPLRIISWRRAVRLSFLGKVEVVDVYEREIRSVSYVIKVPAVVRLLRYVKLGQRKPPLTKLNLLARDHFSCQYCGTELVQRESTMDHVVPRSRKGRTCWENVVTACHTCNRRKGGRTPWEAKMQLRARPVAPEWLPVLKVHFRRSLPEAWLVFLEE